MRKIGKVKYNGKSTADLGVIVSGEASFDAAAPDYTSYQIPGKNGDLMLSNNRYLNIDVTYPAFIPADFEEKVQAIRSWMRSARSYARIEDNYDLTHYRMGMGKDVLTFEPSAENVGSNMSLVFDCKPQRFLCSGDEENQIGVWGPVQTASGDIVTFEDDENGAFKSLSASITPTQNLNGYDYPWPAGGAPEGAPETNICPISGQTGASVYLTGRNLFVAGGTPGGSSTSAGITFTYNADGTITLNGRNNGSSISVSIHMTNFRLPPGTYKKPIFRERVGVYVQRKVSSSFWENVSGGSIANTTFVITEDDAKYDLSVRIGIGNGLDFDFDNFVCEPYIYKDGEPLTYEKPNYTRYPVSWQTEAGEVYGGMVDVVTGTLTVDRLYVELADFSQYTFVKLSETEYPNTDVYRNLNLGRIMPNVLSADVLDGICSHLPSISRSDAGSSGGSKIGIFRMPDNATDGPQLRIAFPKLEQYSTVENLATWLAEQASAGTPFSLCLKLAEPITYQITGQQINTLLGTNNVWADSGAVTAEWGEDPFGLYNPTLFDALPLIKVKNPQNGCAVTVNGTTMTCLRRYTGTVAIDCELMDVSSGATNLNTDWSKDFPTLSPGENSVAFSGADAVTIIPRWWEL